MAPRPVPESPEPPHIPQYFAGREVFITGATGFMGKVLVERLLWTCRDISRLHLLMRRKKDTAPENRLAQLKKSQVSVVFHSAATVKFDEPLSAAVDQNVRPVITLLDICDQLPNIQVLIHVSTAYSNAELSHIEERVYSAPAQLRHLLALVDALPRDIMAEITPKLVSPKPNTYTFTKAMAESVVAKRAPTAKYATAIFRPSIVISSHVHPFPGWIENMNGPSGLIVGVGKGLLHVLSCAGRCRTDMVPVDMCIDTLIAVAWETAVDDSRDARVYHCSSYEHPMAYGEFRDYVVTAAHRHPLDNMLWYPSMIFSENHVIQKVFETCLQTVPLYLAHYVFKMCGIKSRPSLSTVCKRLLAMNEAMKFFATREWHFSTDNVQRLRQRLSAPDAAVYNLDPTTIDWKDQTVNFVKGTRKYLLREKDQDIEKAQKRIRMLHMIHNATRLFLAFLFCRLAIRTTPAILRAVAALLRLGKKGAIFRHMNHVAQC